MLSRLGDEGVSRKQVGGSVGLSCGGVPVSEPGVSPSASKA